MHNFNGKIHFQTVDVCVTVAALVTCLLQLILEKKSKQEYSIFHPIFKFLSD